MTSSKPHCFLQQVLRRCRRKTARLCLPIITWKWYSLFCGIQIPILQLRRIFVVGQVDLARQILQDPSSDKPREIFQSFEGIIPKLPPCLPRKLPPYTKSVRKAAHKAFAMKGKEEDDKSRRILKKYIRLWLHGRLASSAPVVVIDPVQEVLAVTFYVILEIAFGYDYTDATKNSMINIDNNDASKLSKIANWRLLFRFYCLVFLGVTLVGCGVKLVLLSCARSVRLKGPVSDFPDFLNFTHDLDTALREYAYKQSTNPFRKLLGPLLPDFWRARTSLHKLRQFAQQIFNHHATNNHSNKSNKAADDTFLSLLLRHIDTSIDDEGVQQQHVMSKIIMFMAAGHETTGAMISNIMVLLATHSRVQTKLRTLLQQQQQQQQQQQNESSSWLDAVLYFSHICKEAN
ncbi:unnamed protein product [Cylindrotheca closterium]|uniref:Cytochrome P450 n=1 Tax=Cylindrotheca closterium TaxID=2856 RepID=A0AAD2CDH9_9STRA|nr:unnamed protein product [Cylindrotheca closterium]